VTRRRGNRRWSRKAAIVLAAVPACLLALASWEPAGASAGSGDLLAPPVTSTTLPGTPPPTSPPLALAPVKLPTVSVPPVTTPPITIVAPVTLPGLPGLPVPTAAAGSPLPGTGAGSTPSNDPSAGDPAGARSSSPPLSGPTLPSPVSPNRRSGPAGGGASRPAPVATTPPIAGPLPLRLRRAVSETAQELSFPLGLGAAILAFLVLQPRLDRGDVSVAHPGTGSDDDLLGFS